MINLLKNILSIFAKVSTHPRVNYLMLIIQKSTTYTNPNTVTLLGRKRLIYNYNIIRLISLPQNVDENGRKLLQIMIHLFNLSKHFIFLYF